MNNPSYTRFDNSSEQRYLHYYHEQVGFSVRYKVSTNPPLRILLFDTFLKCTPWICGQQSDDSACQCDPDNFVFSHDIVLCE